MATPNATALGRPSELVSETSTIGAIDNTSAQVTSRENVCVWVTMAVAIVIMDGSLVVLVRPKPVCEIYFAGSSEIVDSHMALLPKMLGPFFSGALVALFVVNRHRYIAGSKLHFWTLCYAVTAFALSWNTLLNTVCNCNQEQQTLKMVFSRLMVFVYPCATNLLIWLSVLKLRCLKMVAPTLARVGEISGLLIAGICIFTVVFRQIVDEQAAEFPVPLAICLAVGWTVATIVFFAVLVMVLSFSAKSASNEASESDVDDENARQLKISARWTNWTMVATAFSGSTFLASSLLLFYRVMTGAATVAYLWTWELDQMSNVAAAAFLSGIVRGDGGHQRCTTNLKVAAASVQSQERRQIERQLISAVGASAGTALTVAYLMDGVAPLDVLQEAELRFRCVSWEALAARSDIIICGGPRDVIGPGDDDLYSLSEPCHLGDCDAFVSHSWHDSGLEKWEALRSWCDDFVQAQGYHPLLWFDKICICQTEIVRDLRSLPVFLAGCKRLLIISGPTYPTRLWCSMEVLVHRAILAGDAERSPPELLLIGDDNQREDLQHAWSNFDVMQCNCFDQEDKRRFLSVVSRYPGGSTGFNRFVREFAADLLASSEASSPTGEYDFVVRC